MTPENDQYFSKTIKKGLTILSLFDRDHQQRSLTEISELTGINKTSVYRFVNTLLHLGYLKKSSSNKQLKLGPIAFVSGRNFINGFELFLEDYDYNAFQNGADTSYVFDKDDYRPNSDQKYLVTLPEHINTHIKKQYNNFAAFSESSLRLTSLFTLNTGLRYDYCGYNSKGYVAPRISMTYKLNSKTTIFDPKPNTINFTSIPRGSGFPAAK